MSPDRIQELESQLMAITKVITGGCNNDGTRVHSLFETWTEELANLNKKIDQRMDRLEKRHDDTEKIQIKQTSEINHSFNSISKVVMICTVVGSIFVSVLCAIEIVGFDWPVIAASTASIAGGTGIALKWLLPFK